MFGTHADKRGRLYVAIWNMRRTEYDLREIVMRATSSGDRTDVRCCDTFRAAHQDLLVAVAIRTALHRLAGATVRPRM